MEGSHTALISILVLAYTCTVVKQQPVGWQRFAYTLPTLLWCCAVPHEIKQLMTIRGGLAFILTWLTNAKLLAFTANRGPLSHPNLSKLQFLSLLLLPVYSAKPNHRQSPARGSNTAWLTAASLIIKAALFGLMTLLLSGPVILPKIVTHVLYAAYIYLLVSLQLDLILPFVQSMLTTSKKVDPKATQTAAVETLPLQLQNSMDAPFLSSSIKDFWGRRYNQVVSATLMDCVYLPIMEGRWIKDPNSNNNNVTAVLQVRNGTGLHPDPDHHDSAGKRKQHSNGQQSSTDVNGHKSSTEVPSLVNRAASARKWFAIALAFLASGLMHEVMIWYMCGDRRFTWGLMTMFFAVQPVLMALESLLMAGFATRTQAYGKKAATSYKVVAFAAQVCMTLLTLTVLAVAAELLFWQPFSECQIDSTGLAEARSMVVTFQKLFLR